MEAIEAFTESTQQFFDNLIHRRANRNPIEILKRLQRETFSDLMRLRERQDKVERMVALFGSSKGSPFQGGNTRLKGEVDFLGGLLWKHCNDDGGGQDCDGLSRAGIRSGVDFRLSFETAVRESDGLVCEFVAGQKHRSGVCDVSECGVSLAKVCYTAYVCNWLSCIAIPVGSRCRDVAVLTSPSHQGKGLTDRSSFGPPLLNEHNGSAIGIMVKNANVVVASLGQSISGLGMQVGSGRVEHCLSTFGQIICQLPGNTKLSLLGLHRMPKSSSERVNHSAPCVPSGSSLHHTSSPTMADASAPPVRTNSKENVSAIGSVALMLESELDETTKIGGWIEMKKSNPRHLEWAVSVSDDSEDSVGWGISLNGMVGGPNSCDQFQIESYLKFNLSERFSVKPGVVQIMDGNAKMTAFMLKSNWSL
ncbi:PREDICTED: uncharacterized protein LOC101294637 [Fragaria vesca subsp. vesca]|uniref:uncharacterized protein LOC101294637 n=1 Tax=Fragaria vesca subsp. vesca TaxID=101020 RepID=UPI0002C2E1CC|nr:PREDICTED: uncharacterized protein LOC101294637 [Fragaria vesca subsp. vesca]